jgi:16S rRNA (guanine527-N7)-methyltransferase
VTPPDDNLAAALARHNIELPSSQVARLEEYCRLLWDWNSKLNLTRHTDFEKFVTRDLTDSLAFARFLEQGETVMDVGTGGGVPGVVLAIVREDLKITLCESIAKKARAVGDIAEKLGLAAPVVHGRAEDLLADHHYQTLVIRAVARLKKLLEWFRPHWSSFDRMLVLKGPGWIDERGEARHFGLLGGLSLRKLYTYPLPGTDSESALLQFTRRE